MKRSVLLCAVVVPLLAGSVLAAPNALADDTLANGFSAKLVAQSGQRISGLIDASGYDVGVYIGPGVHDVQIAGATVRGANDEGIFVQDASDVLIKDSRVEGNGVAPAADVPELKAIVLAGTHDVVVMHNTVANNDRGGIGVYDDGPTPVNAPIPVADRPIAAAANVVSSNRVLDNGLDCGIVISAKHPGAGLSDTVVRDNTVTGFNPAAGDTTASLGGIIVAGGAFGAVSVTDTMVLRNTVSGGSIPGISLHASGSARITGTHLSGNVLSRNGAGAAGGSTGIEILSDPGVAVDTQITSDKIIADQFGIFHVGDTATHIAHLSTTDIVVPVAP